MKKTTVSGLKVNVEHAKGSFRYFFTPNGRLLHSVQMRAAYGHLAGTKGMDAEEVDVYVGPHKKATTVYLITQMKRPYFQEVDEQKAMLGFASEEEAKATYLAHYDDPRFFGGIKEMSLEEFKTKVFSKKRQGKMVKSRVISQKTFASLQKGGPYIGPRGGKWADPEHTIPWTDSQQEAPKSERDQLVEALSKKLLHEGAVSSAESDLQLMSKTADGRADKEAEIAHLKERYESEAPYRALRERAKKAGFKPSDYNPGQWVKKNKQGSWVKYSAEQVADAMTREASPKPTISEAPPAGSSLASKPTAAASEAESKSPAHILDTMQDEAKELNENATKTLAAWVKGKEWCPIVQGRRHEKGATVFPVHEGGALEWRPIPSTVSAERAAELASRAKALTGMTAIPSRKEFGALAKQMDTHFPSGSLVVTTKVEKSAKIRVPGISNYQQEKAMRFGMVIKGGPYIGPKGGKWADPQHTIPWTDSQETPTKQEKPIKTAEARRTTSLQYGRTTYTVERSADHASMPYRLTGPRGSVYGLMRNVKQPHMLFLVNARGGAFNTPFKWVREHPDGTLTIVS